MDYNRHKITASLLAGVDKSCESAHFAAFLVKTSGSPALTTSLGLTKSFSTVDPAKLSSARTEISNFMASRRATIWFASSVSPSFTCIFQTFAFKGLSIFEISGSDLALA